MNCLEMEPILEMWLDDELSEELVRASEAHLARCESCREEMARRQAARTLLRQSLEPVESSPSFRERTAARLVDRFGERLAPQNAENSWQTALPLLKEDEA